MTRKKLAFWRGVVAVVVVGMAACSSTSSERLRVANRVTQAAGSHVEGVLGSTIEIVSTEHAEIVAATPVADDGLVARVPGACGLGCPGAGAYDADIAKTGGQFPVTPFPVAVAPDSPTRLMLLVTTDGAGKAALGDGSECLYVRGVELRLAGGETVLVGAGEAGESWVLAVPPDGATADC